MNKQKVWLVTGAGQGFGLEITRAALDAGDRVVATVRNDQDRLSYPLKDHPELLLVLMDVTNEQQVREAVGQAISRFERLDVVVNNAGYGLVAAIEEASDAEARAQYDTNVFGVLNVIRAVLPFMRKQRSGHIINTSSLFAFDAVPGWALYGSTKFAVEGISQGLAKELEPFGIHVTAIEPGLFSTGFTSKKSYRLSKNAIDDYTNTTVGYIRTGTDAYHGKEPGDPVKLAKVIVELSTSDQPPLHLPIGPDSLANYKKNAAQLAGDVEKWKAVSMSTDR